MSEPRRPVFTDGQLLAADDLTQVVAYTSNRDARHSRYLHAAGIAFGLELAEVDVSVPQSNGASKPAKDVTLKSGLFVDGHGQEVVVPEDQKVSTALVEGVTLQPEPGQDDPNWSFPYPLFIRSEETPDAPALSLSACSSGSVTRIAEGYELVLGQRGDHLTLGDQRPAAPGDDLSDSLPPWRLLLGFVRVDTDIGRFVKVIPSVDGVGRQYAGVHASRVVGHGGRIELRPADSDAKRAGKLIVAEDRLAYGPPGAQSDINPVFSVSDSGDVTCGSVKPLRGLGVPAVSGLATHGMVLPLPAGVTEDDVKQGTTVVHSIVTPALAPIGPTNLVAPVVYECSVDSQRRVTCLIDQSAGLGAVAGTCNYLVLTAPAG